MVSSDVGATRNGIYEKNITLDVSKRVAELLRKKGYIVEMTRTTDKTVSLQRSVLNLVKRLVLIYLSAFMLIQVTVIAQMVWKLIITKIIVLI